MTYIEWGAEIAVNGVRPEWLRDEDQCNFKNEYGWNATIDNLAGSCINWPPQTHIRLPATHPYYLATSRGFTYWPGGESAPADWDGGEVLLRDGRLYGKNLSWEWRDRGHWNISGDTIGYRKRTEQPAPAIAPELVERMVVVIRGIAAMPDYVTMNHNWADDARAILAELEPDPDLTLAKSIVGDAEAIALAIKAARENAK